MAAYTAASEIRARLAAPAAERGGAAAEQLRFAAGKVGADSLEPQFAALCRQPHMARIALAVSGYRATPKIDYDRATQCGRSSGSEAR
ncbi:molybdopterin-dependent oxidoreductase [Xanthomonas translucens pv. graminis]|uniref:molybdopterin cofactor-binding domain-containing protein n=1 Tax=Xanthomonas graminis TaxID=3390026 RepID=UPI0025415859|nr:molybdopterin cofactor-binding domain-containing protein [Xanthomonas translucens]WIH04114.1 molybdopterin-dependent oxidoreductase [Xanthomonas translucens pv. graminis]